LLSSTTGSALGTASAGTSTIPARADHVHPTTGLGLTSGTLAQFAATTSAQLASVISDETGSGALVFATSPTLTTPNIGAATGTSLNLTGGVQFEAIDKDDITTRTKTGSWQSSTATIAEGWPETTNGWYHLLSNTHNNTANYYSQQFAGSFNDSLAIWYRATAGSGTAAWHRVSLSTILRYEKTASYTLVSGDVGTLIEMNVASGNTLTVPTNASVAFPIGAQINILQTGAGQVTVAGAGGVTVNATPGLKLRTQWSSATLIKRATDTWVLVGDLSN
jgi:hypothetical protein